MKLLEGRLLVLHRVGTDGTAVEERRKHVNQQLGAQVVVLEVESLDDVSSSPVRSEPAVLEYIRKEGLYSFARDDRAES